MSRNQPQSSTRSSLLNQKAFLASAYQELGKELSSTRLKSIGSYTLGRTIGEGTYGKVRIATHKLTGIKVAIKQIPKTTSLLGSLTREIHHHRRLHHPNIIQLYEVIATENHIYLCTELCPGGELYDYLLENQFLKEFESRRIFGQLALALAYCHAKGIVHRDLKLENVLLDEKLNVKLGDFGFTREFERDRLLDTFCGTTGYAAPEMLRGERYRGEEVDIWSLGIILYALLFGALPFDDDDEEVMKQKIWKGEFEMPPDEDGIMVGEEARDLITQILQLSPTKRPTIKQILSHPWFSKTIRDYSMSTVEEAESLKSKSKQDEDDDDGIVEEEESSDEGGGDGDLTTRPANDKSNKGEDLKEKVKEKESFGVGEMPGSFTPYSQNSDLTEMSSSILSQALNQECQKDLGVSSSTINTSEFSSSSSSSKSSSSISSDHKSKVENQIASPSLGVSTISTDSRSSFYSAMSDSESSSASASDVRSGSGKSGKSHLSGKSDETDPTTDDGDGSGEFEQRSSSSSSIKSSSEIRTRKEGEEMEIRPERLIGISQKNESQTTIKREDSSATIGNRSNSTNRNSISIPLPTHHESPGSQEAEDEGNLTATTTTTASEDDPGKNSSRNVFSNSNPNSNSTSADEAQRAFGSSPTNPIGANSLTKRSSQSSSKGHHRTPSRTKRRSMSSGALSDHHHPPSFDNSKPVDYISLMTQLQPALFSTTLEQNLLHQLSSLGMDVGQIVHSILNDACDASGALWWLLKRKAEEREAYVGNDLLSAQSNAQNEPSMNPSVPSNSHQVEAPPVPPKDPNRRSSKEFHPTSKGHQSQSQPQPQSQARDGLPKGAQDSFRRRLDASTTQALAGILPSEEERGRTRSGGGSNSKTVRSSSHSETAEEDGSANASINATGTNATLLSSSRGPSTSSLDHLSVSTRGGGGGGASSPDGSTKSQKAATASSSKTKTGTSKLGIGEVPKPKRNRTNSFSMKQFTGKLSGGGGSSVPTVKVGEEELPLERAKSPVSNLFGKRTHNGISNSKNQSPSSLDSKGDDKREERRLTPSKVSAALMAEKLSPNPDSNASSPSRKSKSKSKSKSSRGSEKEADKLKAVASMGTNPDHASPTRIGSKATSRFGGSPSPAEIQAASQLTNSASTETFSTLNSSEDHQGKEDSNLNTLRRNAKGSRTRSSFLSTVRTWLGSEDRQTRKQRKSMTPSASGSKLSAKGPSPSLGHSGPGSTSQGLVRTGSASARARASPYQTASPSTLSRRSTAASGSGPKSPQRGSVGRRGSTGSAHLIALLDGKAASTPKRPSNYRRQSAGSITPTATMYGDVNWELGGGSLSGSAVRGSRPSSSQSMRRGPASGSLHAKSGSASSSGSLMRLQQQASMSGHLHHHHLSSSEYAGSLRGLHGRRPSDGSTTVRRHRPYSAPLGGNSRRTSSIASRGSSPGPSEVMEGDIGDNLNEHDLVTLNSGRASARTSIDSQGKPRSPVNSFSPSFHSSATTTTTTNHSAPPPSNQSHSVFVAHKSRSPFKPPSANPSLHGVAQRSSSTPQHGSRRGSENGNKPSSNPAPSATWRRSWGRPPPSWNGPIDDQPSTEELIAANKPKLRDVFAAKEGEDEWIDEEEVEPSYSGGLGQLNSFNSSSISASQNFFGSTGFSGYNSTSRIGGGIVDSPFGSKNSKNEASNIFGNKLPSSSPFASSNSSSSSSGSGSGLLSQGRYAGVRSLFQPPSLGREVSPKMLSISKDPVNASALTGSSLLNPNSTLEEEKDENQKEKIQRDSLASTPSPNSSISETLNSNPNPGGTTRRGAQPPAFKQITIEEEEEDE